MNESETRSVEFFNSPITISVDSWHYEVVRLVIGPRSTMPRTFCEYVFWATMGLGLFGLAALVAVAVFVMAVSIIVVGFVAIGHAIFSTSTSTNLLVVSVLACLIAMLFVRSAVTRHVRYYSQGVLWKGKVIGNPMLRWVLARVRFPSIITAWYYCAVKKICVPINYTERD